MTIYTYIALKDNNETVKGKIEAENIRNARAQIKKLNLLPIKVYEEINLDNKQNALPIIKLRPLTLKEKIDFASTYQTLSGAGVPVVESLLFMEQEAGSARIRNLARELRRHILAGGTFADTIKRYNDIFDPVFVGLTKAGEDSGEMETTMQRIIELLRKQEATRSKVQGALMYPGFVIIIAIVVIIVMLTFVFPKFAEVFVEQGKELPLVTSLCIKAGDFIVEYWYAVILLFIALGFGIYFMFKYPVTRNIIDKYALKLPLIGNLIKYGDFANYLAVLQVAYDAGVPIVNSLTLAGITLTNVLIQAAMNTAKFKVQQGLHLSAALRSTGVLPKMLLFMIQTGEQSGKLGTMLAQAVVFIDKELEKFIETLTKFIEPIMLIVLGGIVLFFALALYLPLFDMITPA